MLDNTPPMPALRRWFFVLHRNEEGLIAMSYNRSQPVTPLVSAVVFPGQGSQRRGMAMDFVDQYAEARDVFLQASEALSLDLMAICRDEDERLGLTAFTQPCILTAEIAMLTVLRQQFGFTPTFFGGHSLGEYTALVAAGAIPFVDAVRLVHERGKLMQSAVPVDVGGMTAIIGDAQLLERVREKAVRADIDVANDNSPQQIVISGELTRLRALEQELHVMEPEALRIVPLSVSAPFHSRFMQQAEVQFRALLQEARQRFDPAKAVVVTSNFYGEFYTGTIDNMVDALARQISGSVRWRDNMAALCGRTQRLFEVGPGKPLNGFFQAIDQSVTSILSLGHAKRAAEALGG